MEVRSWDKGVDAGLESGQRKMEVGKRGPIRSYRDLEVYQITYAAAIEILVKVLPKLPKEEKFDLVDQLRRSCKFVSMQGCVSRLC